MLALLRVAPLLPSPTLRAVAKVMPGRDGKSRLINRTGKRCSSWRPVAMHYYFGPPMHLLSGVDRNAASRLMQTYQQAALTLAKMRSGGKQTVVVQDVHVNEGGKAVIAGGGIA